MQFKKLLPVLMIGYLTSCSILSPIPNQVTTSFILQPDEGSVHFKQARHQVLAIALPSAPPIYDTTMMAYSLHPLQLSYYVKNQWAEKPAVMIQSLLVQKFQQAKLFRQVMPIPSLGNYDVMLFCRVDRMQQDYANKTSAMNIALDVQLISRQSLKTIAAKEFVVSLPVTENNPRSGVLAANQGMNILIDKIISWTKNRLR